MAEMVEAVPIAKLLALAEQLKAAGRRSAVADLYKAWIAHNPDDPFAYVAYFNYGTTLGEAGDLNGAILAFRESARLQPQFHQARLSLGLTLEKIGQRGAAVAQWMAVSTELAAVTGESVAHKVIALENIGRVLEAADSDEAAEDALRQRLELALDDKVIQHWIALRMRQCKWPVLAPSERLRRRDLLADISPLSLANLADDPLFQLGTAARYNRSLVGVEPRANGAEVFAAACSRPSGRLRIGYLSSDLRDHAVGFAMTEVMELHDRSAVEVFAYYCGIEAEDATKARIRGAVDHWVDVRPMADADIAARIAADGIDILVDLNGYTKDARTRVFAFRPASIAVNWFGFPSTMGSPYHHYLIADAHIVPEGQEMFYSEKVVRLSCYQANDRRRVVASPKPCRADEGLPEGAMVYSCLNGLQKLTRSMFERWLAILGRVPDSVLWLLGGTAETQERLRRHAAERGIAGDRLVFAQKKANPDHIARYALADLFLDTLPYGAHTTASDALWMGVPVLTQPGRSFASRVCASLVSAAEIGDMIAPTAEAYVERAVELGLDRRRLAEVRGRLVEGRDTCLLFDTPRLVRDLEALYRGMWDDFQTGRLPMPDLANLDVYHAIGLGTEVEDSETLSHDAYLARYRDELAIWARTYPLPPDTRLRRDDVSPELGDPGRAPRRGTVKPRRPD